MSDNSTRWQRVVSQSGEKPRFRARQTTGDLPPPAPRSSRSSSSRSSRSSVPVDRTRLWWTLGVIALTTAAGVLTWLVFFT